MYPSSPERSGRCAACPETCASALSLGDSRRHQSDRAHGGRRHRRARRAHPPAGSRVRLGSGRDRAGGVHQRAAVWPGGTVRRRLDAPLRPAACHVDQSRPHRLWRRRHDPVTLLAPALSALGRRGRDWHGEHRVGAERHGGQSLVHHAPRAGARPARRRHVHGSAHLSAAAGRSRDRPGLAGGGVDRRRVHHPARAATGGAAHARLAGADGAHAVSRGERSGVCGHACPRLQRRAARAPLDRPAPWRFLAALAHLRDLWGDDQRVDRHAPDSPRDRPGALGSRGRRDAGDDGRARYRRHARLWLAERSV